MSAFCDQPPDTVKSIILSNGLYTVLTSASSVTSNSESSIVNDWNTKEKSLV